MLRGQLGDGVRHLETGLLQQGLQDMHLSKTIFNNIKIGKNTIVLRECPSDLIPVKPKIRYRYLPYFRISRKRWPCCGSESLPDAGPDSTYYPDADPDADPDSDFYYLTRIRNRLFTLMRIRIRIQILASEKSQTLEEVLK